MTAAYVRETYGVDYKRGDRVTVDGRPGTVVSFPDQYLGIRFDGEKRTTRRAHPTWEVAPLDAHPNPAQAAADRIRARYVDPDTGRNRLTGPRPPDPPADDA